MLVVPSIGVVSMWAGIVDDKVYLAYTNEHMIRKMVLSTGMVTTVSGLGANSGSANGKGSVAQFNYPSGIAVDEKSVLYVADTENPWELT